MLFNAFRFNDETFVHSSLETSHPLVFQMNAKYVLDIVSISVALYSISSNIYSTITNSVILY